MVSFKLIHLVFGALLIAFVAAVATVGLRPAFAGGGPLQYSDVCVGDGKITPPVPGAASVVGIVANPGNTTCVAPQVPMRVFFQ